MWTNTRDQQRNLTLTLKAPGLNIKAEEKECNSSAFDLNRVVVQIQKRNILKMYSFAKYEVYKIYSKLLYQKVANGPQCS